MSIAPNYYKFKKYNLLEICNIKEPTNTIKQKEENASIEEKKVTNPDKTNITEDKHLMTEIIHDNEESKN